MSNYEKLSLLLNATAALVMIIELTFADRRKRMAGIVTLLTIAVLLYCLLVYLNLPANSASYDATYRPPVVLIWSG